MKLPNGVFVHDLRINRGANFDQGAAAVGSAFKQLHYQAYWLRHREFDKMVMVHSAPLSERVRRILDQRGLIIFDGGKEKDADGDLSNATGLYSENRAPGKAGPGTLVQNLMLGANDDNNARINFLERLMPIPIKSGKEPYLNLPPAVLAKRRQSQFGHRQHGRSRPVRNQ